MDPITKALLQYRQHLEDGGKPADLGNTATQRQRKRKLHPSALGPGLCDRRAAYDVMADLGEITVDIEYKDTQLLSFQVGHIFQTFVAQALAHAQALVDIEFELEDDHFVGRADLIVNPEPLTDDTGFWIVDVKAVKSQSLGGRAYYPKPYYVAQLEKYCQLLPLKHVKPVLFITTRLDLETQFLTWEWHNGDCYAYEWNKPDVPHMQLPDLGPQMDESEAAQLAWLTNGILPDRCGLTPDQHPFMCCDFLRRKGQSRLATPSCKFFKRCWEVDTIEPFDEGSWMGSEPIPF